MAVAAHKLSRKQAKLGEHHTQNLTSSNYCFGRNGKVLHQSWDMTGPIWSSG